MKTISELIKQINECVIGNIYKKVINGKTYYYHQYFSNGKRYSEIVDNNDVISLLDSVNKRKELEKKLKALKALNKSINISNHAQSLTGAVMLLDKVAAKFDNGELTFIDEKYAPLIIKKTRRLEDFLKLRTIDFSRTNARILRKALNIKPLEEEYLITLYSYALSLVDRYWFKPKNSKLKYKDVRFNNDYFFETALKGRISSIEKTSIMTPEVTTVGSFEKGWKLINDEWWLYKSGAPKDIFSELFCYEFAKLIDLPTARYEYDNGHIRSKNFADINNFEPIYSIVGNNEDYEYVFNALLPLGEEIAKQYLKLLLFDTAIYNIDRHNENYGLMRDVASGKIVSLAPNFDNNLALISTRDYLEENIKKDPFAKNFIDLINNNEKAKRLFSKNPLKEISKEDLYNCLNNVPIRVEGINYDQLINAVLVRYNYLKDLFNKQHI